MTDEPNRHPGVQCIKLTPGRVGWWNKLECFAPGLFEGRCVFLDLDTIVTGPLDPLVKHKGCLHLDDWGWPTNTYGSGVMVWQSGEHADAWLKFTPDVAHRLKGDQDWLTALGGWDALPRGLNVSYRYHAKDGPPAGASTVSFHGSPKPHELPAEHWVHGYWR